MTLTVENLTETINGRRVWLDIIQHPKDTYWHRCTSNGIWELSFQTKTGWVHHKYVTFTPDKDDLLALKMNKEVTWKRILESTEQEGFILRTWSKNPAPVRFTLTEVPRTYLPPTVLTIKNITEIGAIGQETFEQELALRTQTLASILSKIRNLGSTNVYLKIRKTELHDYFVLSDNNVTLNITGGVSLLDTANNITLKFARIKSISRRFRALYKVFLMATSKEQWVEIAEDMKILVNQVPRRTHTFVLHNLLSN